MNDGEKKKKSGLAAVMAALAVIGAKGGAVLLTAGEHFGAPIARAASHLAPVADDAVRGGATILAHEGGAAAQVVEHGAGLVDDGGKFVAKGAANMHMSDGERITRSAVDVAKSQARRMGRGDKDDEKDR